MMKTQFVVRNSKTNEEYGPFKTMDSAEAFMLSLFDARYFALYRRRAYVFSSDGMYTEGVRWTEEKHGEEYTMTIAEVAA